MSRWRSMSLLHPASGKFGLSETGLVTFEVSHFDFSRLVGVHLIQSTNLE